MSSSLMRSGDLDNIGRVGGRSHVAFLGSLGVALELKRLDHSLSKFGHCHTSIDRVLVNSV
jgi:hypothetical protein